MKKKLTSLLLVTAMLASLAIPVMGAGGDGFVGSVEGGQDVGIEEPEYPKEKAEDDIEIVTDNIVTGGYILQKGVPEVRPLEMIDYPVIKITTLAMSGAANAKVDATNPGASHAQKAGIMTESALPYAKNAVVNNVGDRYYGADSTEAFIDEYELSFFDRVVTKLEGQMDNYKVIQIADISANTLAISSSKNSVRLVFSAPGVKVGSRVMVARIRDNSMEFVAASAGNGKITFDVDPSMLGTFVLMTYVE